VTTDYQAAGFTPDELAKLDSRLGEAIAEPGAGPFEVTVAFNGPPPSPEELAPMGLARLGDLVLGRVDLPTVKRLAGRDDVHSVALMGESYLR
jgi:hypothetical protein